MTASTGLDQTAEGQPAAGAGDASHPHRLIVAGGAAGSGMALLRTVAVTAGVCWSVLFVVVGLRYAFQMYGDGSLFSYAVAVRDAWAFHWHNISGRLTVYVITYLPPDLYVALTRDARGGIILQGFLFFAAQLIGLAATWAADRSKGRLIFTFACASTACLCPLVFGFPTEMWMAHALFWPALAVCHYARGGILTTILVFVLLLALVFTHEGAVILSVIILATLSVRGIRNPAFLRTAGVLLVVIPIWLLVKLTLPPDSNDAPIMQRAALQVFELSILTHYIVVLLASALVGYAAAVLVLRRLSPANAYIYAAALTAIGLAVYWLGFDHAIHATPRYFMRTLLLVGMATLGVLAAAYALDAEGYLKGRMAFVRRPLALLACDPMARAIVGAIVVVTLVHVVEIIKFAKGWTDYEAAVRALAMGTSSDPELGDPRFVSSARIGDDLNRLNWNSTTPYLSVLLAPGMLPRRLVVDPAANYFWLSCATAKANEAADLAVPVESRRLVRVHACLHR